MITRLVSSRREFLVSLAAIALGIKACQPQTQTPQTSSSPAAGSPVSLYGAGATFPSFLYLRWFSQFNQQHPNVQISYQPVGSAAGIQQFLANTVDFGASEVTPTDEEMAKVSQGVVLIPTAAGSVAVVYNLPEVKSGLKLSREVLPEIFLGRISQWNDPKIADLNPGINLPNEKIILIHRSDGSGTTAAFTSYLSAASPEWKEKVGAGLNVAWAAGVGIKDNSGIAAQIQQAAGTIGYVEYAFAKQLGLAIATLQNKAGQYVPLTDDTVSKGLASITLSDDLRGSIADPEDADAYPIITYSWILAYNRYSDPQKAKALKEVLRWGLTEGQKLGPDLGYVPIPADIAQRSLAALDQIEG